MNLEDTYFKYFLGARQTNCAKGLTKAMEAIPAGL